ncbi:hypothetical protein RRG08_048438 [Elysia crispata]|uniref:Uncharacterized protein n=1 Tax=Elysia crispata TaxID=231223 RepID=A0AAE1BA94_9GAST|nr:hypothetical protein RRG08_048438 [Elysia crispata]
MTFVSRLRGKESETEKECPVSKESESEKECPVSKESAAGPTESRILSGACSARPRYRIGPCMEEGEMEDQDGVLGTG